MEPQLEVEVRSHFIDKDEVYQALPFFQKSLYGEAIWSSGIYGLSLFKAGQLLRIGEVRTNDKIRVILRWKSQDSGTVANIRTEIGDDITNGIRDSIVLRQLGGLTDFRTVHQVIAELDRIGHHRFMGFEGHDWYGKYEPMSIEVKMMYCPVLKWPWLVEFEKMANTIQEARRYEAELEEFARCFKLDRRLIHEEPPTMLYAATFGKAISYDEDK